MLLVTLLGITVVLIAVGLRNIPRGGYQRSHLAIASLPLVLTIAVPLPFALAREPTGWARGFVVAVSVAGIMLSFILLAVGIVLTQRAMRARERPRARLLALETALAGIPALIMTTYAAIMLLL